MRQVLVYQDEYGSWNASVPSLPGCQTCGRNQDEAVAKIREAIAAYLGANPERGHDEPIDLSKVARDVTAPDVTDLRVFTPVPVSAEGIAWGERKVRELLESGEMQKTEWWRSRQPVGK